MENLINCESKICRLCSNTNNLIDLFLPGSEVYLKNLSSFVFVEVIFFLIICAINYRNYLQEDLLKQLPKFICNQCNSSLTNATEFKTKIIERYEKLKTLFSNSNSLLKTEIKLEENIEFPIVETILEIQSDSFIDDDIKEESCSSSSAESDYELPLSTLKKSKKTERQIPGSVPDKYSCVICKEKFTFFRLYVEHKKIHLNCTECNSKFINSRNCFSHYRHSHHYEAKHICPVCCKSFTQNHRLKLHVRSVHQKEKNVSCEICNKEFFDQSALKAHKVVHFDVRPYKCDQCDESFKQLTSLNVHKTNRHLPASEKAKLDSFVCSYCGQVCKTKSSLQEHTMIHTGEFNFNCDVCQKKFRRNSHLNKHKRLHTGEKPYKCDVCPKEFRISQQLLKHKKTHGAEKKYSCTICGMTTAYKDNLDIHVRSVHMKIKKHICEYCGEAYLRPSILKRHLQSKHKNELLQVEVM